MPLTLNTAPTIEPVNLSNAKAHLRVSGQEDDLYITDLIIAARRYTENVLNRALITQTWEYYLDDWPETIEIPMPPLQSVTSVKYTDLDGSQSTFSSASYTVDTDSEPGRIILNDGYTWPNDTLFPTNPIQIIFVAGYGDSTQDVPADIRAAIKLTIANYYENREPSVVGPFVNAVPMAIDALLYPYRLFPV